MTEIRLNKFIASSGIASRRKADELIEDGEVFLNGKQITTLGTMIDPKKDKITIYGAPINAQKEFIYLAINKPQDYVVTLNDEFGRRKITDLVPPALKEKGLKPIGRLDKDTEGLIVLTNDLELINLFTHPKYEKEKEYFVRLEGHLLNSIKTQLENGIHLEGSDKKTLHCEIEIVPSKLPNRTELLITLKEGRKRQIRKMFQYFGFHVLYLQRIRIGKLSLKKPPLQGLKVGQSKLIEKKCLQA